MTGKNNQVKTEKSLNKPETSGNNSQIIQFFYHYAWRGTIRAQRPVVLGNATSGCALPSWDMNPECLHLCRFSLDQYRKFLLH